MCVCVCHFTFSLSSSLRSFFLSYGFRLVHTMTTAMSDDVISNSVQLGFIEKEEKKERKECRLSLAIEMLILKEEIVH